MKELNAFRKFLNENEGKLSPDGEPLADIDPNQTVFSVKYRDEMEGLEATLYVAANHQLQALNAASQYMKDNYEDSYEYYDSRKLSEPFGGLDPYGEQDAKLRQGNIADFGIDNY